LEENAKAAGTNPRILRHFPSSYTVKYALLLLVATVWSWKLFSDVSQNFSSHRNCIKFEACVVFYWEITAFTYL